MVINGKQCKDLYGLGELQVLIKRLWSSLPLKIFVHCAFLEVCIQVFLIASACISIPNNKWLEGSTIPRSYVVPKLL